MSRIAKRVSFAALVLSTVVAGGLAAQSFGVDGAGNVEATSFSGSGSGLTAVPTTMTHDYFELECPSGTTCVVFKECPAGYEVSGGGLFINSGDQALRRQVVLHQSFRATPTQWSVEATNNSAEPLGFGVTSECVLVPATPDEAAVQSQGQVERYQLLMCPEGDHWQYIGREDVNQSHYCPHDGARIVARGIRRYPLDDPGNGADRATDGGE